MIEYHNVSRTTLWIAWMPTAPKADSTTRGWWLYWPKAYDRRASFGLTDIYFNHSRMTADAQMLRRLSLENGMPSIEGISFADQVVLEAMCNRAVALERTLVRGYTVVTHGPFQVSL